MVYNDTVGSYNHILFNTKLQKQKIMTAKRNVMTSFINRDVDLYTYQLSSDSMIVNLQIKPKTLFIILSKVNCCLPRASCSHVGTHIVCD